MLMIKGLALAGAIVGVAAFAPPVGRSMSAPDLRVPAPRINRGSAVVRSMSGDGTKTLVRPSVQVETLEYSDAFFSGGLQLRQ